MENNWKEIYKYVNEMVKKYTKYDCYFLSQAEYTAIRLNGHGSPLSQGHTQSPGHCSEAGKEDRSYWLLPGGHAMVQGTQSSPEDRID